MRAAALFVYADGVYSALDGVDHWGADRDARKYDGPWPVVAHPPCNLWVNFDAGCFSSALASVRKWGGVLEHPAFTNAWGAFGLDRPGAAGWLRCDWYWVCEVWQSAYGHIARKRTWLLYSGANRPDDMNWERPAGTHQVGGFDVIRPVISGRRASATPTKFAEALVRLAENSGGAA